ncbi:MAG: hypothetical protein PHR30_14865 [Gallionellaceae bacterium]|nr:hypothetical protein [Gallionellaceae bacterium]
MNTLRHFTAMPILGRALAATRRGPGGRPAGAGHTMRRLDHVRF